MEIDKPEGVEVKFGDARDGVVALAVAAGIDYTVRRDENIKSLTLSIPNGRKTRTVRVDSRYARVLVRDGIDGVVFLGEYQATFDRTARVIEAYVRSAGRFGLVAGELSRLPGVQTARKGADLEKDESLDSEEPGNLDDVDEVTLADSDEDLLRDGWKLIVSSEAVPLTLELSPVTERLSALAGRRMQSNQHVSLKIRDVTVDRHDELLDILERYASALFFEIDIRFGVAVALQREPGRPVGGGGFLRRTAEVAPLSMPKNRYAKPATDLYFYARSAAGMPLLQYLAYYQAIEFFFPSFWNAEVLRRLRQELRDIRFNVDDDGELQRLVNIATNSGRGGTTERQQMRATIASCVDDGSVLEFMKKSFIASRLLKDKKLIEDVPDLNERANASLTEQIADRVYAIRCRIVHAKEDGGAVGAKVILPYGAEAENLRSDIVLIRYLAQKVIIAGSRGSL